MRFLPANDQGHRAVTIGLKLEIAGERGSGAPPCYAAFARVNATLLAILFGVRSIRNQLWMVAAELNQVISKTVIQVIFDVRQLRYLGVVR